MCVCVDLCVWTVTRQCDRASKYSLFLPTVVEHDCMSLWIRASAKLLQCKCKNEEMPHREIHSVQRGENERLTKNKREREDRRREEGDRRRETGWQ